MPVVVDDDGVMRWTDTGAEVALFGVDHAVRFAHGQRVDGYLGVDRKRAIEIDVDHLARPGLDAFRVHLWDREIPDREGNRIVAWAGAMRDGTRHPARVSGGHVIRARPTFDRGIR